MTEVFRDDDAGYERWLAENPGGYVVTPVGHRGPTT